MRFEPGLGPGMPFLLVPFCGGASELPSTALPLSAGAVSGSEAVCSPVGSMTIASADMSRGVEEDDDLESNGKRASRAGARRKVTRADLDDLVDIFKLEAGEAVAVTVVDEVDMILGRGVEMRRCVGGWTSVAGLLIWRLPFSGRLVR